MCNDNNSSKHTINVVDSGVGNSGDRGGVGDEVEADTDPDTDTNMDPDTDLDTNTDPDTVTLKPIAFGHPYILEKCASSIV